MKKVKELTSTGLTSQQIQTRPENVIAVVTDKDKYKKKDDIEEDILYDVNDKDKVLDTDRKKLKRRRIVNKWESIFKEEKESYYYISGNKGMMSSGSFTADKSRWIIFSQEEKNKIEQVNRRPYGATKQGIFINVNKF